MMPLGFDLNGPELPARKPADVPRPEGVLPHTPLAAADSPGPRDPISVPRDVERDRRGPAQNSQAAARNDARNSKPTNFQRAMGAVRAVLPTVQKMLPLLEGNIAWTAANFLAPSGHSTVDLTPVKDAINKIHADQVAMRGHVAEYEAAFGAIQDQLKSVSESLERTANEQNALSADLRRLKRRTSTALWLVFGLFVISLVANVLFYLQLVPRLR